MTPEEMLRARGELNEKIARVIEEFELACGSALYVESVDVERHTVDYIDGRRTSYLTSVSTTVNLQQSPS